MSERKEGRNSPSGRSWWRGSEELFEFVSGFVCILHPPSQPVSGFVSRAWGGFMFWGDGGRKGGGREAVGMGGADPLMWNC